MGTLCTCPTAPFTPVSLAPAWNKGTCGLSPSIIFYVFHCGDSPITYENQHTTRAVSSLALVERIQQRRMQELVRETKFRSFPITEYICLLNQSNASFSIMDKLYNILKVQCFERILLTAVVQFHENLKIF